MESWEQLRAQARKIEGDVERALPQLASLAADGDSGAEAQRLLKTVEDHLKALARVRDSLLPAASLVTAAAWCTPVESAKNFLNIGRSKVSEKKAV